MLDDTRAIMVNNLETLNTLCDTRSAVNDTVVLC